MRTLALSPFHAGSHAAFLDGWRAHSRHAIDALTLPGRSWKWRMRGAAVTFADRLRDGPAPAERPAALWCTDMLDLAAFRGLAPRWAAGLPAAVYFHENQLTYPTAADAAEPDRRDEHFGFTNLTTALAAGAVWFNSEHHRGVFLEAVRALCRRLPDRPPADAAARIAAKSAVLPPGIDPPASPASERAARPHGPLRVVWASRWEHDKRPAAFFAALDRLIARGVRFEVSVLGERYAAAPACFEPARRRLGTRVRRWGFLERRADYEAELTAADVIVSTAGHEFFGLAVAEAAARGCVPAVPDALAYPGVWGAAAVFHDNTPAGVAAALERLSAEVDNSAWPARTAAARTRAALYHWPVRAAALDVALERLRTGP